MRASHSVAKQSELVEEQDIERSIPAKVRQRLGDSRVHDASPLFHRCKALYLSIVVVQ